MNRDLYCRVLMLLGDLPLNWRSALVERCFQEKSYQDIAAQAMTTEANIRKRVQLARSLLNSLLSSVVDSQLEGRSVKSHEKQDQAVLHEGGQSLRERKHT